MSCLLLSQRGELADPSSLETFVLAAWLSESRTPQLDWNIQFTGLFMVTGKRNGVVLKVHENSECQVKRVFPLSFSPERVIITQEA